LQEEITLNSTTFSNCYTAHVSNLQRKVMLYSTTFSKCYTARVSNLQGEITLNSTSFSGWKEYLITTEQQPVDQGIPISLRSFQKTTKKFPWATYRCAAVASFVGEERGFLSQ
jgi:hypothetical protein